jgi:hypothetical protein
MSESTLTYFDTNTKILQIDINYNNKIKEYPEGIKEIIFHRLSVFNHKLSDAPNTITKIKFGKHFNKSIDNLPTSLIFLTFGQWFNQPIEKLPKNITHLTFGISFNQPVNNLPPFLTHLTFDAYFNQPLEKYELIGDKYQIISVLPQHITHLTFGSMFNQSVNFLPPKITNLTFGYQFNQPIDIFEKNLKNLKYLEISESFKQSLKNLPKSLDHITFSSNRINLTDIPEQITSIYISGRLIFFDKNIEIPLHIKKIKLGKSIDYSSLKKIPFGCKIYDHNDKIINM